MKKHPGSKAELEALKNLLQQEKKAEQERFNELLKQQSATFRRHRGHTWYPLMIVETGFGMGDYPFVVVERTSHKELPHAFHGGKTVRVFSQQNDQEEDAQGIVHFVQKDRMKIFFHTNDFPDVLDLGKLGVDLLFDENSYREMEKALKALLSAEENRLAHLREILLGYKMPEAQSLPSSSAPHLNEKQNEAVQQVMNAKDVALIHGPPGTGKTTTLCEAVKQLAARGEKLLVCAPSNAATDLLTERLAENGVRVIRVGHLSRIDENILQHTLEGSLQNHPEAKNIKDLKKRAAEFRKMGRKYKRHFGKSEREQRKMLIQEARSIAGDAVRMENLLVEQLLHKAQVITATLVGSANRYLAEMHFDTVVIDEAAQALEPATWVPILKSNKVILAGDPFQLPPTVKSNKAAREGLNITLLEKGLERKLPSTLLEVQYRMNEKIMGFSNQWFYNNQLKAHSTVKSHHLAGEEPPLPIAFIDTAGCGFDEETDPDSLSSFNAAEADLLWKHFKSVIVENSSSHLSAAIITPYKAQAIKIREMVASGGMANLAVNTVDAFQGQERDVVYLSLVRSNEEGKIGFLSDYRRMNVAMTRARKKLVIVGDSATLGNDPFYASFLEYCEKQQAYFSAWEWM